MAELGDLFNLANRVACVTGASSGLGRRAAVALAAAGAQVVGVARRKEELEGLCSEIGSSAASVVANIADRDAI
ncbi:MAG: SDR family NAD(P)-dependent oxidoreductase, partial [Paracoccaceae bacterium]|nr:SDR family NAD(P)-dependent oxidoreductase [Paracoccaceae bacterium]